MARPTKTARGSAPPSASEHGSPRHASVVLPSAPPELLKKRVTIADLARVLGMDKSSVSLALRDSPRISEATRVRVRHAANEHNYSPNWAAKQLAGSPERAIGLVMPSTFGCLAHAPVVGTMQALARLTVQRGLTLNLIASEQLIDAGVLPLHADGLLVWGDVPAASTQRFSAIHSRPSIVLDPHHPSYAGYPGNALGIQNHEGACAVVRHLLERGAQNLIFVQVVADHLNHVERWHGAREAWLEHRSAESLQWVSLEATSDVLLQQIAARRDAAIFCSNDRGAMQLWHRMQRLGLVVPRDVKLAGFDGDEYGALAGLTTALFDSVRLAEMAFDAIVDLIENGRAEVVAGTVPVVLRSGATS